MTDQATPAPQAAPSASTAAPTDTVAAPPAAPAAPETQPTPDEQAVEDAILAEYDVKGGLTANPDPFQLSLKPDEETPDGEAADPTTNGDAGTPPPNPDDAEQPSANPATPPAADGNPPAPAATPPTPPAADSNPALQAPSQPAAPQVADPGEFTPGDHGFEITLKDGKTYTVKSPEDAVKIADIIDENPDAISARQFMEFNQKTTQMQVNLQQEKAQYDQKKQLFEQQQQAVQDQQQVLEQWTNELTYLTAQGKLPKIADGFQSANWADPTVAAQPGVKETLALFKFMETENIARQQAKLPPIRSVLEAYNIQRVQQMETAAKTENQQDAAQRKAKGAMIGGGNVPAQANQTAQKGVIIGTGGSLDDLMLDL